MSRLHGGISILVDVLLSTTAPERVSSQVIDHPARMRLSLTNAASVVDCHTARREYGYMALCEYLYTVAACQSRTLLSVR
jgi:hypothetical protein